MEWQYDHWLCLLPALQSSRCLAVGHVHATTQGQAVEQGAVRLGLSEMQHRQAVAETNLIVSLEKRF